MRWVALVAERWRAHQSGVHIVESTGEAPSVAIQSATGQPGVARASIPGDRPVVEAETHRRQALVVRGDRREALQRVPKVIAKEADQTAKEPWRVRGDDWGGLEAR